MSQRNFCFYHFVDLTRHYPVLRSHLLHRWTDLGVTGRVYLAPREGLNGNVSVPAAHVDRFAATLEPLVGPNPHALFNDAVGEAPKRPFTSLHVRWRSSLVNVGRDLEPTLEELTRVQQGHVAQSLGPAEWNAALDDVENTLLLDARNDYEVEVGHMDREQHLVGMGARTFRHQVQQLLRELQEPRAAQKRLLMFCTSGIRCSKLAAVLAERGHTNVAMLDGGVTRYVHRAQEQGLPVRFRGHLFSFDEVLSQRVTEDVLSACRRCARPSAVHINCENQACHVLFVICDECRAKSPCCSAQCDATLHKASQAKS